MNKEFKEIIQRIGDVSNDLFGLIKLNSAVYFPALIHLDKRIEDTERDIKKITENQERIITILEGMGKEI